jgi:peptide chain release factor 1
MTVTIPDNLRRKLEEFRTQFEDIERQLVDPETLADHRAVARLSARRKALEPLVSGLAEFEAAAGESDEWRQTIAAGDDADLVAMAKEELPRLESRMRSLVESIQSRLVNADDDAVGSVIMEIRAGVGGDEAGLWAGDLLEMYQRFAAEEGWSFEMLW